MTAWLRDPTAETAALKRPRLAPPRSLDGLTVALMDIGKTRSDEFLDAVEARLRERSIAVKRYRKPTNTKTAPTEVIQTIAEEADVVLIGLSD